VIALTYVLPLDSRVFTREIYEMATECPIVFPEGIGIVPWMLCGGKLIGDATSEIMKTQDVAIWAHHGAFCCGQDFDLTFGLMHTVEKAAEVLVKVMSMSSYKLNTITPEMFRELNAPFGVHINEKFLYEKKDGKIGQIPEV
jgi:rhamnulose-1-phosphate aldolase